MMLMLMMPNDDAHDDWPQEENDDAVADADDKRKMTMVKTMTSRRFWQRRKRCSDFGDGGSDGVMTKTATKVGSYI